MSRVTMCAACLAHLIQSPV